MDLLDLATGHTTLLPKPHCSIFGDQAVSDDGRLVAVIEQCPDVAIFTLGPAGPVARRLPVTVVGTAGPLRFSPDGKFLAIANIDGQGAVGIIDTADGRTVATLSGQTGHINDMAYSPDGTLIATASADGTTRIWDPRNGRLLRTLDHPDPVFGVAFSPDSRTVATIDSNGIIRLWDACTGCENPSALLALAMTRVTRQLTAEERRTYHVGS
jgi:WD40 repeat protein